MIFIHLYAVIFFLMNKIIQQNQRFGNKNDDENMDMEAHRLQALRHSQTDESTFNYRQTSVQVTSFNEYDK